MIEFFDTTVLVAAMVEDEAHHEPCRKVLESARDGFASAHSLAECFATLTGGRLGIQLSPKDAANIIRHNIHDHLSLVHLSTSEYMKLLETAGPVGARGGAVYDLLLLNCARKIKAQKIYTLNRRHFIALAPELSEQILSPQ